MVSLEQLGVFGGGFIIIGFIIIGYTSSFAKTVFTGKVGDECVVPWQ